MREHAALSNEPSWDPDALNQRYEGPLAQCPFCASSDIGRFEHTYAQEFAFVCANCGAHGPRRKSCEQAAAAWNGRK